MKAKIELQRMLIDLIIFLAKLKLKNKKNDEINEYLGIKPKK